MRFIMKKIIYLTIGLLFMSQAHSALPDKPTLTLNTNDMTITASWSAIQNASSYILFYAPYPYQGEETIGQVDMANNTTLSIDLVAGAAYYIAIRSVNSDGLSDYSNVELFISDNNPKLVDITGGTFTMGEAETDHEGKPGSYDAFQHNVTISNFQMSSTEVTNEQYVAFLNSALQAELIKVEVETNIGPDKGYTLVYGTDSAPSSYAGQALINLSGTRVMKDHDNADGDIDPFTGVIEPENPLNISYIAYNESSAQFSVKDPTIDFDWQALSDYCDYTSISHQIDATSCHNDYANWAEINAEDNSANLPTLGVINNWPVTFVRWYGAKAFALFYQLDLPTEAQWEYAARGGQDFIYATSDGNVNEDGSSANWNYAHQEPALGHVYDVKKNLANPYGLYNMAGNVWEWVEDWHSAEFYENSENSTDPVNTTDSGIKVRRGGSWNYHKATLKTASRFFDEKFKGNDHFGFRVVKN
jgi:sulfatase modifying factor 1